MARYSERRRTEPSRSTKAILAGTILLIAWGAFAFGAVYEWAYTPLAVGCAGIGTLGLVVGRRQFNGSARVFLALTAFGVLALAQLIPLPAGVLGLLNPGTLAFLRRYDLAFALPAGAAATDGARLFHAVSIAPSLTIRGFLLFLAFALMLAGLCRALSRTSATQLAKGVVLVGCLLAMFGIGQKVVLGDHAFGGMRIYGFWRPQSLLTTPFGPFINKNHFAGWMLMATPLAICLAAASLESSRRRGGRGLAQTLVWLSGPDGGRVSLYSLSALVMCSSLMLTGSRSGLICVLIVVGGVLFVARRSLTARAMTGVAVATLALLMMLLQWAGRDAAVERFVRDSSSLSMRLSIWKTSLGLFAQAPVFGTGLNTFGTAMIVSDPDADTVHYAEAHNDYVQLLVETGGLGLALALFAAGLSALAIHERFRADEDGLEMKWARRGATIGLVAIAVQSLVEFSLQMPGNATLFVALLAIALFKPSAVRREAVPERHDEVP